MSHIEGGRAFADTPHESSLIVEFFFGLDLTFNFFCKRRVLLQSSSDAKLNGRIPSECRRRNTLVDIIALWHCVRPGAAGVTTFLCGGSASFSRVRPGLTLISRL